MSQPTVLLPRGDTTTLLFNILNPDGVTPADLTGASIIWRFADPPPGGAVYVTKDTTGGLVTITNALAGQFAVPILEADTLNLDPRSYWHEAEVRLANGGVTTTGGVFQVTPTVRPS